MMTDLDLAPDPDWDTPLRLELTPELIVHAVMDSASAVHTGWQSCVDEAAVLAQMQVMDDTGGNAVRLVEQAFADEADAESGAEAGAEPGAEPETGADVGWHDWAVEVRIGKVVVTGHWQLRSNAPPLDWEWHERAAEAAFARACVLLGRRVRRGLVVEEPMPRDLPPRAARH